MTDRIKHALGLVRDALKKKALTFPEQCRLAGLVTPDEDYEFTRGYEFDYVFDGMFALLVREYGWQPSFEFINEAAVADYRLLVATSAEVADGTALRLVMTAMDEPSEEER